MAYDRHPYKSPSQSSGVCLSSSISCLDGVPFKIGTAFRPPARAFLPPELLQRPQPSDALNEEYSYETEEGVLAWAKAREEAKRKAAAQREAAEKARAALAAAADSDSSDEDDDVADVPDGVAVMPPESVVPGPSAQVPQTQPTQPSTSTGANEETAQAQPVKPPWQLPLTTPVSSAILTPMPIQSQAKKVQSPAGAPRVDFALFEQEGDPFDNLELQTIDDMEELRNLLGSTNVAGAGQNSSPNPDTSSAENDNQREVSHSRTATDGAHLRENYVPWSLQQSSAPSASVTGQRKSETSARNSTDVSHAVSNVDGRDGNVLSQSQRNSQVVAGTACDDEYVQIRTDYSQQAVSFQRDSVPAQSVQSTAPATNPSFGGALPAQFAGSKLFKPVLPPIPRPRSESLGVAPSDVINATYSNSFLPPVSSSPVYQNASSFNKPPPLMSQSAYVPSTSHTNVYNNMSRSEYGVSSSYYSNVPSTSTGFGGGAPASNPTASASGFSMDHSYSGPTSGFDHVSSMPMVNGVDMGSPGVLRNAKSNPDLSTCREASMTQMSASYSPQPWNPFKPLPPTPRSHSPDVRSSSSGSPSPDHQNSPGPSRITGSPAPREPDPYNSLAHEAKAFVNNLTSMGFSRSRAARAVQKFGMDEREVLDHLLNVDKLVEKKFKPELAETGLQLFRNDIKKAEQFLDLYQQFTELGFTGDRIQTALLKHQLDRDKALDYLTT